MTPSDGKRDLPNLEISRGDDGSLIVRFGGRLEARALGGPWRALRRAVERARPQALVVDASNVEYCDAGGAALLRALEDGQRQRGGTFRLSGFPADYEPVLDLLRKNPTHAPPSPPPTPWIESVGRNAVALLRDMAQLVVRVGELTSALGWAFTHPHRVRWRDAMRTVQQVGVDSLPVVLLVAGLLGLILGFQSAQQLHRFGGDIFLANLIGVSMLRELGPLMTAIVLTARSGSAFAAEIGTMKINEEVDALRTMGADPTRFLITPRVLAALAVTPILTVFANLAGVAGGAVVWVFTLDLTLPAYLARLEQAITPGDFFGGLFKSFVFGILVAAVGCIRGMSTRGGASAVGESTTSAVVSGIVLLALSDGLFTVLFYFLQI
jgi:phospholipid/cholesterol/gamma-HCH transport system permease protein